MPNRIGKNKASFDTNRYRFYFTDHFLDWTDNISVLNNGRPSGPRMVMRIFSDKGCWWKRPLLSFVDWERSHWRCLTRSGQMRVCAVPAFSRNGDFVNGRKEFTIFGMIASESWKKKNVRMSFEDQSFFARRTSSKKTFFKIWQEMLKWDQLTKSFKLVKV